MAYGTLVQVVKSIRVDCFRGDKAIHKYASKRKRTRLFWSEVAVKPAFIR